MSVDFTRQKHQHLSGRSSCNDFDQGLGISEVIRFCDCLLYKLDITTYLYLKYKGTCDITKSIMLAIETKGT
jgi:hypothetical protein